MTIREDLLGLGSYSFSLTFLIFPFSLYVTHHFTSLTPVACCLHCARLNFLDIITFREYKIADILGGWDQQIGDVTWTLLALNYKPGGNKGNHDWQQLAAEGCWWPVWNVQFLVTSNHNTNTTTIFILVRQFQRRGRKKPCETSGSLSIKFVELCISSWTSTKMELPSYSRPVLYGSRLSLLQSITIPFLPCGQREGMNLKWLLLWYWRLLAKSK